jgi:uncharacterized protein YjbI with pentapeptide repeats
MLSETDFQCELNPTPLIIKRSTNQKILNQIKRRQKRFENGQSYPSDHILTVRGEGLYGFNFIGMKFQRVFFDSSDLGLVTFDNCVGSYLSFSKCSMNHAKFTNCQVTSGGFVDCSLVGALFSGIFKHINFIRCYMNQADLTGAKFIMCRFWNTDLTGAKLSLDPADWEGSTLPSGAKIS